VIALRITADKSSAISGDLSMTDAHKAKPPGPIATPIHRTKSRPPPTNSKAGSSIQA